jgi:mannose-6-phosphate isomerase-like protein (cupin superfamily)
MLPKRRTFGKRNVIKNNNTIKMKKINIEEKLSLFSERRSPKIVAELNGQHVKLVKLEGDFIFHKHDHEDEMFLVIKGWFNMEFEDHIVRLEEGEFLIVPRGVVHRPVAPVECSIMLFEPSTTLNTGDIQDAEFTKPVLDWI